MGKKADDMMKELGPTRSLLRTVAEALGVTIDEPVTEDNAIYFHQELVQAILARGPAANDAGFKAVIDQEVARAGGAGTAAARHAFNRRNFTPTDPAQPLPSTALISLPHTGQDASDADVVRVNLRGIARELGLNEDQSDAELMTAILDEILRIKGAGGDVEVPKGDSLGDAVAFGHRQNNELRDRLAKAELLLQRIANSLQVTHGKDGEGAEILEAVQRTEVTKIEMRRRIVALHAQEKATRERSGVADELEAQFVRLLSPAELAAWRARRGRPAIAVPEHGPHPFQYEHHDLSRIASAFRLSLDSLVTPGAGSIGALEVARRSDLGRLFSEIGASPAASEAFAGAMDTILAILARERASEMKD